MLNHVPLVIGKHQTKMRISYRKTPGCASNLIDDSWKTARRSSWKHLETLSQSHPTSPMQPDFGKGKGKGMDKTRFTLCMCVCWYRYHYVCILYISPFLIPYTVHKVHNPLLPVLAVVYQTVKDDLCWSTIVAILLSISAFTVGHFVCPENVSMTSRWITWDTCDQSPDFQTLGWLNRTLW